MKYNYLGRHKSYRIILADKVYIATRRQLINMIELAIEKMINSKKLAIVTILKDSTAIFYNDLMFENQEDMKKYISSFEKEQFDVFSTSTSKGYIKYEKSRKVLHK